MCPKLPHSSLHHVIGYSLPTLHTGKLWFIDFYVLDPARDEMRRKKYHLNMRASKTERRKQAAELIALLTARLRQGWNPFVQNNTKRCYTSILNVLQTYEKSLLQFDRKKTFHSYSSRLNIFREFLNSRIPRVAYVYQIDQALVVDFLDWLSYEREVGPRTRNNYRGWMSSLCAFMVERTYLESNPVEKIKTVQESEKVRQPLTATMLSQLNGYLQTHDKHYLLACMMEYYTFIRPTELSYVRLNDIMVKERKLIIPSAVSKNRSDGAVALNDTVLKLMLELGVFNHPGEFYLFGPGFRPSAERRGPDRFNKKWVEVRKRLKWGTEYQFYSLKDSGIRDLANAKGIVVARDQARHSDVTTTNKYLKGRDREAPAAVLDFKGSLG